MTRYGAHISFAIVFLFLVSGLTAQVRPDEFIEETNPNNTNFEVYSQKGGQSRRASLVNLRKYFGVEILTGSVPSASGNSESVRNKIVLVLPDSITYFVDWNGDAVKLGGGDPGTAVDTFYINATKDTIHLKTSTGNFFAVLDFPTNTEFQDSLTDLRADLAAIAAAKLDTTLADSQIFVGNSNNKAQGRTLSGDATLSNTGALTLANSGVSAGSYGSATQVPTITFDAKGRATAASNTAITGLLSGLTANRIPVATGATALGNGYFLQDANGVTLDAQRYFRQTGGTTLQRPAGSAGMEWYNTDLQRKQIFGSSWENFLTSDSLINANAVVIQSSTSKIVTSNYLKMAGGLQLNGDLSNGRFFLENHGTPGINSGAAIYLRKSDGTYPSVFNTVPINRILGTIEAQGYNAGYKQAVQILFTADDSGLENNLIPGRFEIYSSGYRALRINKLANVFFYKNVVIADDAHTVATTQKLHVVGNARITGAYYDSNNDPGTTGQYLQSTTTGTDWKSEYVGFNYYDADPDTLSPSQGQIFELDATGTVSGWTQQLKSTNMCTGCAFTIIIKTLTGGKDITIDSPSGDFLVDTTDTSAATGSLGFSGSATVRRRVIWTGTYWLFVQL